jgi:hypothetical protein
MVKRWLLCCGLAGLFGTLTTPSLANHDERTHASDDTAYTLEGGKWRLGLWKAQYGASDRWTLGTYTLPWVLKVVNAHVEWRWLRTERWHSSVGLGYFGLVLPGGKDKQLRLQAVPFEWLLTYQRTPALSFTTGLVLTSARLEGEFNSSALLGTAAAAGSNSQWLLGGEYRLSQTSALIAMARVQLAARYWVGGDVVLPLDAYTTAEVHGAITPKEDVLKRANLLLAWHGSWEHFNLRLGVSLGHYDIPGVHFMLTEPMVLPELDLYWLL